MKNVFYFGHLNAIGGIETFFYNLSRKYKDWDITIYYGSGDIEQIKRLRKYVRVKKYNNEYIKCDKAFFNFNIDIIDKVEAKEYIQILHGDYKQMQCKPPQHEKITRHIGVSKTVCDGWKELTGEIAKVIYNPVIVDSPKRVLYLISATRLTADKGKDRMIKLCNLLDRANIPYLWFVFTDDTNAISNPNVIYMKPRLDITSYINKSDYLVQLSNAEGYCYSLVEALSLGVPVITTNIPVAHEIGVKNGKNGFIVDFEMENVPIEDIYNKKLTFEYKAKEDTWDKELVKGKSTYDIDLKKKYKVKATKMYKILNAIDKDLKRIPEENEVFEVDFYRYEELKGNNIHNVAFVEDYD